MSALDRDGLVHETIEHLIDQVAEACKERDALQAEVNMRKFERDEARSAYDALWTCFNDCAIELKAQRERGDTYRRRALALRRQAKAWRILTNIESTSIRREISLLKRVLVNEINYLKEWHEIK